MERRLERCDRRFPTLALAAEAVDERLPSSFRNQRGNQILIRGAIR